MINIPGLAKAAISLIQLMAHYLLFSSSSWPTPDFFTLFFTCLAHEESQKIYFCELNNNNGNPLDPNLFSVKYQKC